MVTLVLVPTEANAAIGEKSRKEDTIRILGFYGMEIIFALLTKLIAVYIKLFVIYIQKYHF